MTKCEAINSITEYVINHPSEKLHSHELYSNWIRTLDVAINDGDTIDLILGYIEDIRQLPDHLIKDLL